MKVFMDFLIEIVLRIKPYLDLCTGIPFIPKFVADNLGI